MGEPHDKGARRRGLCDLPLFLQCHLIQRMNKTILIVQLSGIITNLVKFNSEPDLLWFTEESTRWYGIPWVVTKLRAIPWTISISRKPSFIWSAWLIIHNFFISFFMSSHIWGYLASYKGKIGPIFSLQIQCIGRTLWKHHGADGRPCSGLHSHVLALQVAGQGGLGHLKSQEKNN